MTKTLDNPDPDALEEVTEGGRQVLKYKKGKAPKERKRYTTRGVRGAAPETPTPAKPATSKKE